MSRRSLYVHWLSLGIIAGVALAIAASVGVRLAAGRRSTLVARAIEQSYLSSISFAEAAETWMRANASETLHRVVQLMLLGGSVYVEIVMDGKVLYQEPGKGSLAPDVASVLFTADRIRPGGTLRETADGLLIDSIVPITPTSTSESGDGFRHYIRVCSKADYLRAQLRQSVTRIAGVVGGSYGGMALLTGLLLNLLTRAGLVRLSWKRETEQEDPSECFKIREGPLTIDTAVRSVTLHEQAIDLPPKPYELLLMLAEENGGAVSEERMLEALWSESPYADSNDIRQCIYQLRRRLDAVLPKAGRCIANVRGFGYRFDVEHLLAPTNGSGEKRELQQEHNIKGGRNA